MLQLPHTMPQAAGRHAHNLFWFESDGVFLPPGAPPTLPPPKSAHDWSPYRNDIEFATAKFTFKQCHMSNAAADTLFNLMAALLAKHDDNPPFADHKDLHKVIDAMQLGDVPWRGFSNVLSWMDDEYDVWYRDPHMMADNILVNPTYKKEIDYTPLYEYDAADDTRRWKDFMSGDWAWQQATTISVGTGNNEYYPLYASIGNVHNNVRHAHCDALIIIGFLTIPKTKRKDAKEDIFWNFCHQLFHCSLSTILSSLKPRMTEYEVLRWGCINAYWHSRCLALRLDLDGGGIYHSRGHTYLMISELPVDTLWFEYGLNSHVTLLSFDLLHQLIKGAFKDHLVDWVVKYLRITHGTKQGDEIMADIDRRIAAVASFPGLRRFHHEGHNFRQWTGNDSKVLMKVFIPAIEGHVPQDMVRAFHALLEFCFLIETK
ncbi:hypothetical protein BDR07DRAFT_1455271 [Suillus spraguei]|nr:hypothetical protein BDR07DRAFT_1455271 [Suillus spraguei]